MKNNILSVGAIILGLIYFISPIDLFSEIAFPVIGYLDDATIMGMIIWGVNKLRKNKKAQAQAEQL